MKQWKYCAVHSAVKPPPPGAALASWHARISPGIPCADCLEAKLQVCPSDNPLEREVDRVADLVMRTANHGTGVTDTVIDMSKEVVAAISESKATIASGRRTPKEQSAAMYANLDAHGVAARKALYANAGDTVIDAVVKGKAATPVRTALEILLEMTARIMEIGQSKVSRHRSEISVIDVAPRSIAHDSWSRRSPRPAFVSADISVRRPTRSIPLVILRSRRAWDLAAFMMGR